MITSVSTWTCLLLLYAHFIVGMTAATVNYTHCPTSCQCSRYKTRYMYVHCHRSPDVDQRQQSNQFDSMLSNVSRNLMELSIDNSSLTHVPLSVCLSTNVADKSVSRPQPTISTAWQLFQQSLKPTFVLGIWQLNRNITWWSLWRTYETWVFKLKQ